MNAERAIAVCRDAGCMALGLGGIAWQQYTNSVNELLLGAYLLMLGLPVGANLRAVTRQVQRAQQGRGTTGTRASQSSSRSSGSSSGRSSSSTSATEGGE